MTPGISIWHRTDLGGERGRTTHRKQMSRLKSCGASVTEETPLCGRHGLWPCLPHQPFWLCTPLAGRCLCFFCPATQCIFPAWLRAGASTLSARRDWQMFHCSTIPENNSLVWERALRSAGPGTEAASPSSVNSSASSTNLCLCCWVVSALAGDGNMETDFYSLGEVSFPPRMDADEISWAGVPQEEDVGHCQWLVSRAGSPLLEP